MKIAGKLGKCVRTAILAGLGMLLSVLPFASASGFQTFDSFKEMVEARNPEMPEAHAVTSGPKQHWFGYYLHYELDASGRYLLANQVDFNGRLPRPDDAIKVGMIDLQDNNRWIELGESRAWSWQQGCFLQWRPGSETEVVWNDRDGDKAVCRVLDVDTDEMRTLPMAIDEAITPDGRHALCSDFSRIWKVRKGYGIPGIENESTDSKAPESAGVWRMDMETGKTKLLVSLAELSAYGNVPESKYQYVNHFAWSPNGDRFLMFHRWKGGGQPTRVYTMDTDGDDLRLLCARGGSHWAWRDPDHVLIHDNNGYSLYEDDGSGTREKTLWDAPNGHQSYIPGTNNEWLVTDTYPRGKRREQHLYLHHLPSGRFIPLGRFRSPPEYKGAWRCDLHPRVSRDGTKVFFDSTHEEGRQIYMVEIDHIIETAKGK